MSERGDKTGRIYKFIMAFFCHYCGEKVKANRFRLKRGFDERGLRVPFR